MPVTEKQSTEVAVTDQSPNAGALATLSSSLGLKPSLVKDMVKSQCFKNKRPEDITDTQLAAYISTANAIREVCPRFNPLLPGMLYAYPDKNGGIDVMMGPDCVFAMLSTHPDYDGGEHEEIFDEQGNFIAATVRLYLKSSQGP